MFKQFKIKLAARRLEKKKNKMNTEKTKVSFWTKIRQIAIWPLKALNKFSKKTWQWIRRIDLIGLINLTLLIAIIVLFSVLIMNIFGCNKKTVVLVAPEIVSTSDGVQQIKLVPVTNQPSIGKSNSKATFALKNDAKYDMIKHVKTNEKENRLYGEIIVDGTLPGEKLSTGVKIQGNLYLQNMRRYTLPCNTHINGNLFLRDVDMLKFCGDFVVTGNIYVSRRSSFGPIPRTARLGGQVIF